MTAFQFRMDVGYAGATNRQHDSTVVREAMTTTVAAQPTSYGVMLAMDATGVVRAPTAGDTAANFAGLFVRPYPTQGGGLLNPINDGLGVSTPPGPAAEANVMKRGFMTVKLNAASPGVVKGQPLGIFIGAATAGNPAGGITGAAPGATVIAIPNSYFQGPADGNGITEIAYNLQRNPNNQNGGPHMPDGGMFTYDSYTRDSTGAFYIGELERLDQTIHDPLYSVTWGRDVDVREDITTGDEVSSFTNSSFAASGGIIPGNASGGGISWIGKDVNSITGAQLDIGKTPQPLFLWGMELSYTVAELASAMQVGRPIDTQKYDVIRIKHQMDIDQLIYVGDPIVNTKGLINHTAVANLTPVTGGSWTAAAPDNILAQVNELLASVWAASGWAQMPDQLRVPPIQFGLLVSAKVSTAGNISVLRYLQENSLCNSQNGKPLNIQPLKWLQNAGAAGAQRMICYTKAYDRIRYPMTPLQRTPLEWRSLYNMTTYWGRLGVIEIVYPETIGYRDGI